MVGPRTAAKSPHCSHPPLAVNRKSSIHARWGALLLLPLLFLGNVGHATIIHFQAALSGPGESPPNASPGTGLADVYWNDVANTMEVKVSFTGLVGTTTASHIHAATAVANTGTAGVATQLPLFTGFPTGLTAGTYDHTFDMTLIATYNPAFVAANGGTGATAEAAFHSALVAEKTYLNVHTTFRPGGEIRGFLHSVPDTASTALLLTVPLGSLAAVGRKMKSAA